jgi:hypothetical protein
VLEDEDDGMDEDEDEVDAVPIRRPPPGLAIAARGGRSGVASFLA